MNTYLVTSIHQTNEAPGNHEILVDILKDGGDIVLDQLAKLFTHYQASHLPLFFSTDHISYNASARGKLTVTLLLNKHWLRMLHWTGRCNRCMLRIMQKYTYVHRLRSSIIRPCQAWSKKNFVQCKISNWKLDLAPEAVEAVQRMYCSI